MAESKQNTHLEHLEDDIINLGYAGAERSIAFLEALLQLFSGKNISSSAIDITVKWDGAPAVVAGPDPETGLFFVATKYGAFSKIPKLCFSETLVDYYHDGGLAETLKVAFRELSELGMTEVLQGDIMFTSDNKKEQTIDGMKHITFKPNTIMYAVPKDDPLGKIIDNSNLGVVFHTKYSGRGAVNKMSASFGVDVSKLKSKTAWIKDASYSDISGKATLTAQETRTVSSTLANAKRNAAAAKKFLDELATQKTDLTIGYMFKIFINRLVRDGKEINQTNINQGLEKFIIDRIKKKEETVKTVAAKERYKGIQAEIKKYLSDNRTALNSMIKLYSDLVVLKNIFVVQLNKVQGIPTFVETENGFQHTDPEGYVAIDKSGGAVKLVNRMEFSQANFNAVKDWSSPPPEPTEPPQKLKTMVFAFGRMNPPTTGHKKLVSKVKSIALREKGDHTIVLSKTQKAPKDPLSPEDKLFYAKKMFPQTNLEIATDTLNTFLKWLEHWNGKYDKIVMVGGSDRVAEFQKTISQYNGKLYTFKIVDVESAGERDADSEGVSGMSASKMRAFAEQNDLKKFKTGIPPGTLSPNQIKELMEKVQEGMAK